MAKRARPVSFLSLICAVAVVLLSLAADLQAASVSSIVKLAQSGMSDEVIIALIQKDGTRFDIGAEDVINLKEQGVSERVILAMLRNGRQTPAPDRGSAEETAAADARPQSPSQPQPAPDSPVVIVPPPSVVVTIVQPAPTPVVSGFVPFFSPFFFSGLHAVNPVVRIGTRPFLHPSPFIDPRLLVQPIVDPSLDRLGISAIITPRHHK